MRSQIIYILLFATLVFSCSSETKKEHSAAFSNDDEETLSENSIQLDGRETDASTLDISDLSEESSQTASSMGKLNEVIDVINSPEKLMEYEQEYESKLSETYASIERTKDSDEKAKLKSYLNEIQHNYNKKRNEYMMPANGIVQNIEKLTKRLESCQNKDDFMDILSPRISYFNNLMKLHTLVAEESRRQEVREKAEALNVLFQKKKAQFGVEY